MKDYKVVLQKVRPPERDCPLQQPELTDETILERKQKLLCAMRAHVWDQLIVYGDIGHKGPGAGNDRTCTAVLAAKPALR